MVECCLRRGNEAEAREGSEADRPGLQDDSVEWDHFYGVSANERRWLDDLEHARETIGYEPEDNGEEWDAPPE